MATSHFEISPTLSIKVLKGEFGKYLKVQRKERWISLSASLWKIIDLRKHELCYTGYVLHLTKTKRLEVIEYRDVTYISLVEQHNQFTSHINFNKDEWMKLHALDINNALVECDHGQKSTIIVDSQKRIPSTLTAKQVAQLQKYNCGVQNQLGLMCLHCGSEKYDNCHCHTYDCKECEPQNFCNKCDELTVSV